MKEDLLSASRHGEALLNCIRRPGEPRALQLCPDKLINVTAVERLLVQLEETGKTFDDFWTRHDSRLTQCLQLRVFESDFKELQPMLEESINLLSQMTQTGDSIVAIDQLLREAKEFHQACSVSLFIACFFYLDWKVLFYRINSTKQKNLDRQVLNLLTMITMLSILSNLNVSN